MLSNTKAPPCIQVPSPGGHEHDTLPLPNATPTSPPSSRTDLLRKGSGDSSDAAVHHKSSLLTSEVKTLRMLFGGSIALLLLCIVLLIIVSVVPLRNARMPRGLEKGNYYGNKGSTSHHRKLSNPFHLLNGPLEALGSIDGMVLQGMKTTAGAPIERYYRIQRVTRIPVVYQQQQQDDTQRKSVRVEFFGGDFILADTFSAALFRRRDIGDETETTELECVPLIEEDRAEQQIEDPSNTPTAAITTPPASAYCAVALIINSEMEENSPTALDASASSNRTRGLQGRTSIYFPYRDGSIYSSPYGQFQFNTGRIFRNGVTWGVYDRYQGFEHWD